jgi:hypothetical protein
MNIQRKYSLPNCTLLLEGLSDITRAAQMQELRPELSILVNAECYLSGYNQPISGGREFFESLVRSVSSYAQEFLGNITHEQVHNHDSDLVQLHKIRSNQHRLIVHTERTETGLSNNPQENNQPIQVDLNTVQLFDLVEAVDQFFADTQTLPELSLELQPIHTQSSGANQVLVRQALPATIGVSSLAAVAFAVSLIPSPQVRPPEPKSAETQSNNATSNPTTAPLASSTPLVKEAATIIPTSGATPEAANTPVVDTTPPTKDLATILDQVPEITDASQLRALNRQVYNLIHPAWNNRSKLKQNLIYRVGVAADGSIIGYKAINRESNDQIEQTPLPNLLYSPAKRRIANEPIAQFRVVFTERGVLEVSPWLGYTKTPSVIGEKITNPQALRDLKQKLYSTIRQSWSVTPSFKKDLKYRVAINKDGVIADYEPLNQIAFDNFRETPLPQMFNAIYGSNVAAPNNKEALAHFEVIFQPNGQLKVSPWQGYH